MRTVLLTLGLTLVSLPASAACICQCFGGIAQPVCTSVADPRPFCSFVRCPDAPVTVVPQGGFYAGGQARLDYWRQQQRLDRQEAREQRLLEYLLSK